MTDLEKRARIDEIVQRLNDASKAYYQDAVEIMPNVEYDALNDELIALEEETGYVREDSPTQNVGYEILSELPKEAHPSRMLSLTKTKDREELRDWLHGHDAILSWKLDGITIVLTYDNGTLTKALTRGNGDVGEVITNNARVFDNVPAVIPFKGHAVVRGEAVISYSDFDKINENVGDADAKYKNARNLCSGSVRTLDPNVTKGRHVKFMAFTLVEAEGVDFQNTTSNQMKWMEEQGFGVVPFKYVNPDNIIDTVNWYAQEIMVYDIPSDGLVLTLEDIAYGQSLGATAKYPRNAIAFKWADTMEETTLREIEWSASRTGLINPVAIFDSVELEGTTVSRASVHNISIMEELGLGIGDRITVYKSNMIIPQISEDLTPSHHIDIPEVCPVCGKPTTIKEENGVKTLYCLAEDCPAKQIKSFELFGSRDAMNIEGISEETLEKMVDLGLIREFADIFRTEKYHDAFVEMRGQGEKSFANLKASLEAARHTVPERILTGLGIPGIGRANARVIARAFKNNWEKIQNATKEQLLAIDGVGEVLAEAFTSYFADAKKLASLEELLEILDIDESFESTEEAFLEGKTFVITGSLNTYENRDELKRILEENGAKVAGSVSRNTDYLINNDAASGSAKNQKARELGVAIITEEEIRSWLAAQEILA